MENELKDFLEQDEFYQEGILTDVKTVVLNRKNLLKQCEELAFDDIDWIHFKYRWVTFMAYELIIFVDENGRTKILKNRWGNTGDVVKTNK